MPFNIYKYSKKRPLSWSALSTFNNPDYPEYSNPEKWYQRYIKDVKDTPSRELKFGKMIDEKLQNDPTFLPELERLPKMQFEMKAIYKNIHLIGYADGLDDEKYRLNDFKTGKTEWTQKRADKTGQLTMYLAMLYLMFGVKPEQFTCHIDWIPTVQHADLSIELIEPVKVKTFYTKRTMADVLKFLSYIEKTAKAMQEYVDNHP